jgi:hypothetical protein
VASTGDLKGETESEIAAQAQALQSKYHATELLQTETHSKCNSVNNLMRQ